MKPRRFILSVLCVLLATAALSCEYEPDEEEEDEDEVEEEMCTDTAPSDCKTDAPDYGYILLRLSDNDDGSPVEVRLFDRELETPADYDNDPYMTLSFTGEQEVRVPNGFYSAAAYYVVKEKSVVAIDSGNLECKSRTYCDDVTCYDTGNVTIDLTLEEAAFLDYADGGNDNCFIATAAYGSKWASDVVALRSFRDSVLLKSPAGRAFIAVYYRISPPAADFIRKNRAAAFSVRCLLHPLAAMIRCPMLAPGALLILFAAFFAGGAMLRKKSSL